MKTTSWIKIIPAKGTTGQQKLCPIEIKPEVQASIESVGIDGVVNGDDSTIHATTGRLVPTKMIAKQCWKKKSCLNSSLILMNSLMQLNLYLI